MNLYSKKSIPYPKEIKPNSVYFAGTNKQNRIDKIHKVYDYFIKNNIICDFHVTNVPIELMKKRNIIYNKFQTYDDILSSMQECECILEIVQPGQTGVTLRYYEAIAYNKRLITNNTMVKNLPYYNPEYMFIFTNIEDIDINWIKQDVVVDYEYQDDVGMNIDDFSPINFLEEIKMFVSSK